MSGWNQENNQNINNLDRARMLRQEAMFLEQKERVRSRLVYLMSISEDEYYNKYLEQMKKDLESGKASPAQVEQEAQRSYNRYRQKMAQAKSAATIPTAAIISQPGVLARKDREASRQRDTAVAGQPVIPENTKISSASSGSLRESGPQKNTIEFKIGMHVFSIIGAIFVLAAFAITGFYFWGGIGTMAVTMLIALGIIFVSRKKESAVLRIISLASCYVCFFSMREFGTELNFLVIAGMLFVVNGISLFFQNKKNRNFINVMHILILVLGTSMFTGIALSEEIHSLYLIFYVITSFLLVNILSLRECAGKAESVFPACCIGNAVFLIQLFFIEYFSPEVSAPDTALFLHLTVGSLILVLCLVTFLLWEKSDGKRWVQLYYATATVLLSGSFSEYPLEILLSGLGAFLVVRLASSYKENIVLDCLVTIWAGVLGLRLAGGWHCWVLAAALVLSAVRIRYMHIYHELVTTLSLLAIWTAGYEKYLRTRFGLDNGWYYLVSAGILLLLFLLFNHLPWTGRKEQLGYNIINVIIMTYYYLGVWFCKSSIFSSVMMALGAVSILVIFRARYRMGIRGKYLVLAGFLTWFSLTGHYESPVIISIFLMVIALGCVGIGFKIRSRVERICGLTMAAFVCLKLVLYDFREVEIMYRVLVFLVVGIIALLISFIYVRLEKSTERQKEEAAGFGLPDSGGTLFSAETETFTEAEELAESDAFQEPGKSEERDAFEEPDGAKQGQAADEDKEK